VKILFINPCLRRGSPTKHLPVGLGYIMTMAKSAGYDFDLYDIDINEYTDDEVDNFLQKNSYDVILYGSIVTHYRWVKWLTKKIKQYHPTTTVVIGNSVAGSCPDIFLANAPADIVVIGEGEDTTIEALDCIRAEKDLAMVEGIAWRAADGQIVHNKKRKARKTVDEFPMVDWSLFETNKYRAKRSFLIDETDSSDLGMPVATARGCVFRCTFCHFVFWDDPYRYRSPDSILDEVERNIEKYGTSTIAFWDDLSFGSLQQAERLSDRIIERNIKFRWSCTTRTDLFGKSKIPRDRRLGIAIKMKEAGCISSGFALESGNDAILEMMNKKIEKQYFSEHVAILKEAGIKSFISVVFGYPIETKETIQETFQMCLETGLYPSIGYLMPLPYTGMYEYAKKNGYISDENGYLDSLTERQDIGLNMTSLSDEEITHEILSGANKLNRQLQLSLSEESLIKTGGYSNIDKRGGAGVPSKSGSKENKQVIIRNENDVSLNYSQIRFD
jgi:anaerobic magnesium-protoporphyrin IX monomethyl ester cyclase